MTDDDFTARTWWTDCDTCEITLRVEAAPWSGDHVQITAPDVDATEDDLSYCPYCGDRLGWNSDPKATWEETR